MSDLDFTLLDDYAQQLNRRDAARTSTALGLGNTQPNAAVEALEIARNLGVPPMAVIAQPGRFRADFQRFTNTNTLIDAPITRGWVDHDAMNAALAQDDLANLSGFERTVAEIALSVEGVGDALEDTQFGRGVQTGFSGGGQMATAVGSIPVSSMLQRDFQVLDYLGQLRDADPDLARHEVADLLGIDANSTAAAIAYDFLRGDEGRRQNHIARLASRVMANEETMAALVESVNAYSAQMQETQGRMPNFTDIRDVGDFADWLSFNTGQAIPYMAATVLAGALGGAPGVIGAGYGMGVGDIQSGLIEEGITDQGGVALVGGIPYAGLELLGPAARPFRGVGGDVLQEVAEGYLRRLGREFGENAVEEFINEAGQEIIRDYAVQAGGGEEVVLTNETLLRWFNAGMAGAGSGGVMAAVSTSPVQRDIERADAAGGTADMLDQIDATVAASQLRQRAPDRFLDFANQTGAGQQLLYVPADGLREYAQARDLTDEDLEAWGVDIESLDQMTPSGGVVSVPMSNYAAMISGTDDAAWFRENATRSDDEMSLAEAAAFNDQVQEVMQEAFNEVERQRLSDEELRAADVQIYDQVFSQLRAAGRSPDVAQNEARVWSAFWTTMGERYGEDPLDLARSMGVRIQSAMTPEVARRRNQTDVLLNELRRRGDAALRPRGMSIIDFVLSEGGVMDPGGEVALLEGPAGLISESRDQIAERQGQPNMLGLSGEARGTTIEDMARRVAEAGYWPDLMGVVTEGNPDTEVDLTQRLLDALSGELAGERVYLDGEGPDANLTQLSEALSARGIDLADVTNDEAIAALEADSQGRTLFQDGYRGLHTAPMAGDGNASLADLTDVFGDDIYGPNAVWYYGTGNDLMDAATVRIMQSAAANPDQPVAIYRAVPAGVSDQINSGDWVTVNRDYAQQHGEYFDDFDLIEMQALPHQIITDGNSIHEFGYDPTAPRILYQSVGMRTTESVGSGPVPAMNAVAEALGAEIVSRSYDDSGFGDEAVLRVEDTDLQISIREDETGVYLTNIASKRSGDLSSARRGSGVGSKAMRAIMAYSDRTGKPFAVAGATSSARAFYERLGMEPADVSVFMDDGYLTSPLSGEGGGGFVYRPNRDTFQSGTHPFEGVTRDEFLGSPKITSNANASSLVPKVLPAVDAVEAVPFDSGVGLTAKYHEDGAAVLKDGKVIASYNFGDTLVVAKGYRRQGIGEELVYQWRMRFPQSKPATSRTKSSQRLQEKVWERIQAEIAAGQTTYNQGEETRRGSIVLPSGGVTQGQTIINLFEGADLSTVIHESGHFFYEAFEALASQDSAPQAMKTDLATLQTWMGVKPGERPSVDAQERMARGFERYLMEGKSPSIELASAFSRFKAWLTRIYRQVAGLNVNLTDEVREVFDRMLATDAAIDEAKAEASMRPLFREAPAGMTDADFRAYQRLGQKAEARAEQNLLERTMEKVRRRKEAWWKEERKATEAEVTESVNRRRAHRLVELLANGQWLGAQEGQDVPDMRIDRAQLVEVFGEGVLQEISRTQVGGKRAIYGDDGASPGEVAEFFGYENAMEMIEELQNTGKRKEVIKSETDRLMEERHGDPLNDGSIEAEAMDAVHSIQQGETIAAEARQLAKQRGQTGARVNNRVFRYRAQQMIARMSVRDASRPQTFLAAERKAARVAERAFAKVARGGRGAEQALAEAYQAKEQQLLNHHLYMEAREIERLVERGRERMRNYDKATVRKKLEGGYIEQIDALLDRFDFRRRSPGQVSRSESLRDFMDRMIEEGRESELMIPPELADESRKVHYSRMSVEELRGLFDAVANLDHMGRFKQKLIDRQKQRDLAESAGTVAQQIRDNFGTGRAKQESRVRNTLNLLWTTDTMLVEMDGLDEFGPAYRQIKEDIDAGQAEEQRLSVELAERLDQLFSVYSAKELREMQTARVRDGVNAKAWSKLEILSAALNTGNADNMQRLLADDAHPDVRMNRDQLDALLSNLDKRDWDFVQSMWDLIDGYWPDIRDVTKRRTGVAPGKVDAVPVVTPYGTYRGGYYPIKYDPGLSANANLDDRSAFDDFISAGRHGKAQTANGHTIKRKQSGNGRTLMLDMNVAFAHMRDVVRDIALSEAVDNSYRILNHPEVVNAFIDAGRQGDHRVLNLWLKDTAKGPIYNTDTINSLARIVKNNFTLSRLAFNMKTVALQITGVGQSAATVGKKAMLRGYQEYLKRPNALAKEVMEMSPFMAERQSTFQKDIYDFANDVKVASPLASRWANAKSAVSKAGFAPIVKVQFYAVDMPTWLAGYNVGLERFNNEAEAIQYADRMVARSQDSGLMGDRNAASRGTVSETTRQADFIRVFTTLAGYMMTKMNRGNITIRRGVKGMSEGSTSERLASAANMATDLILLYVTEAVMMALMYGLMTDEDEPEDYARFVGREIGSAVFGGIPFVRDAASAFSGFGAGGVYGSVGEIPYRVYQQVSQGENDRALRRAIGDVVGITTGLPTTAGLRAIEGIVAPDETSPAEALFGSNPLTR